MSSPRRALAVVLALALPIAAITTGPGCSSSSPGATCESSGTITVTVTNQDDITSNFVCNATVTIASTSGGAASPLTPQGFDGSNANCIYVINEPPGSYVVHATAPGYQPGSQTIGTTCVAASPSVQIGLIAAEGATDDAGETG